MSFLYATTKDGCDGFTVVLALFSGLSDVKIYRIATMTMSFALFRRSFDALVGVFRAW